MQALWRLGKGGYLREIIEEMPEPKPHQNTVATLLKILVEKELVGIKTPTRYNFYYPQLSKDEYIELLADVQHTISIHQNMSEMQAKERLNVAINGLISLASLV